MVSQAIPAPSGEIQPARENAAHRGVLYAALIVLCVAPLLYGSYTPWLSGFAVAAICALGIVHVSVSALSGVRWFPVPASMALPAYGLLGWLCLMAIRDAALGTSGGRFPALSARDLPYAFGFFAAGMLGAAFGTPRRLKTLFYAMTGIGFILALLTLAEWRGVPVKLYSTSPNERPSGIFINPNRFAVMESLCVSCGLALLLDAVIKRRFEKRTFDRWNDAGKNARSGKEWAWLVFFGAILAAMAGSLVVTLSRLTIVTYGVALGLAATLWMLRQRGLQSDAPPATGWDSRSEYGARIQRIAYWALPIIVTLGWVVWAFSFGMQSLSTRFSEINSSEGRLAAVHTAWPLFKPTEVKLFGYGMGSFEVVFTGVQPITLGSRWTRLHSDWMQLALEAGIPALVLALWLTAVWWVQIFRSGSTPIAPNAEAPASTPLLDSDRRRTNLLICFPLAGIFTVLICTGADFPLHETGLALVFFFLAGALAGATRPAHVNAPQAVSLRPSWMRASDIILRAALGVLAVAALGWSGWTAGRSSLACTLSPWRWQFLLPVASGTDPAAWNRAVAMAPADPQLHYFKALAADKAKNPPRDVLLDGLEEANLAAALSPRDFLVPWVAASLCEKLGRFDECEAFHDRAISLFPSNYALRKDAGLYYLRRKVKGLHPGNSLRIAALNKALEYFQPVVLRDPDDGDTIAGWMEDCDCTSDEVTLLWVGNGVEACLARARYLGTRGLWEQTARALIPIDPSRDLSGKRDAIWYHAILGAVEFDRNRDEQGIAEWRRALALGAVRENWLAYLWIVGQARPLTSAAAEQAAEGLADKLIDAPLLVNILALTLHGSGRDFAACALLAKTAGTSDELCALWADCALAIGDLSTAREQAANAVRLSVKGRNWRDWLQDFNRRLDERIKLDEPKRGK